MLHIALVLFLLFAQFTTFRNGQGAMGRLVEIVRLQGSATTVPFTQTATLDAAGQRVVLQEAAGSTTYDYDGAGRLTAASYPDGSTEANSYDPLGDRTTITSTTVLSGTAVTTNSFDAAAQLNTSVVAGGGQPGITTYSYDGNGNQTLGSATYDA